MRRNISILFFIIHNIGFTQDTLSICSFNIQFLGNFKNKDNVTLSKILKPFDIVVIQELVAPPFPGKFPIILRTKWMKKVKPFIMK